MLESHLSDEFVDFIAFFEISVDDAVERSAAHGVVAVGDLLGDFFQGHTGTGLTHCDAVLFDQTSQLFQTF